MRKARTKYLHRVCQNVIRHNLIKNEIQLETCEVKMNFGIAIFGLNGSGKSTLTCALAKEIDFFEIDMEDYYFPEQMESRKRALDKNIIMVPDHIDGIRSLPFSNPRTKNEVQSAVFKDIKRHSKFIISGVTMNWSDEILTHIDIAFWVQAPLEERLKRIQDREEKRFGTRVLDGGDMFNQQLEFRKVVENRDIKTIEEHANKLSCPVIVIDGTLAVAHNLEKIMENLTVCCEESYNK